MANELQNKKYYYAKQLEHNRSITIPSSNKVKGLAEQLTPPSKIKYFFLLLLALIADLVDILGSLTGIGTVVSLIVDIIVSPIIFIASHGANSRIETARNITKEINKQLENMRRRINQIRKTYATAYRISKRLGLRRTTSLIRKTSLGSKRMLMSAVRNPKIRSALAIIADLVPFLDIIPFRSVSVLLTYRDEKKSYRETLELTKEALAAEKEYNTEISLLQSEIIMQYK